VPYGLFYTHKTCVAQQKKYLKSLRVFNISWNFPKCIESIDVKHVRIHCRPKSGSQYFNNKEYNSIVLQRVADANINSYLWTYDGRMGKGAEGWRRGDGAVGRTDSGI